MDCDLTFIGTLIKLFAVKTRNPQNSSIINNHLTQISEFNYFPPEIWTQILAKLPAKTLLKFRCVCKSWYSIIDDQLSQIPNLGNNNRSLLSLEACVDPEHRRLGCLLTVRDADALRETDLIFRKSDSYRYHIIGSCNGLILVSRNQDPPFLENKELRLWNPCIRKSLVIPACPFSWYLLPLDCFYVFGYAPVSKHYKVIAIPKNGALQNPGKISWAVYILRHQQWVFRNDGLNISFPNTIGLFQPFFCLPANVFIKGVAYWLGNIDKDRNGFTHLGSFDFDKEEIAFLELPSSWNERGSFMFLFLLGESLAIFKISEVASSIWVLKQGNEKGTWNQRFSGKSSPDGYKLFKYLFGEKVFFCETDGGYFICGNKSYNIASCEVREFKQSKHSYLQQQLYSESLVLSKGYRARDLRFFP